MSPFRLVSPEVEFRVLIWCATNRSVKDGWLFCKLELELIRVDWLSCKLAFWRAGNLHQLNQRKSHLSCRGKQHEVFIFCNYSNPPQIYFNTLSLWSSYPKCQKQTHNELVQRITNEWKLMQGASFSQVITKVLWHCLWLNHFSESHVYSFEINGPKLA